MKKTSPVWLLPGVFLILAPATMLLGLPGILDARASTGRANNPNSRVNSRVIELHKPAQTAAAPLMTFTVTNAGDTGAGSLRAAIDQANTSPGPDLIDFNLGAGTPSIDVGAVTGTPLPAITDPVTINGSTGGATRIELNGTNAGAAANGLTLMTSNINISGLVINRFSGHGISLSQGSNCQISGNLIGTNAAGTAALPNAGTGVFIDMTSAGDTIGGLTGGNVISGNGNSGVFLNNSNTNLITGNFIGTDITGTAALANGGNGITGLGTPSNNRIGGPNAGDGNIIAFNTFDGIFLANGLGNAILGNAFFANGGQGIALNDDGGVTANDACDVDGGANLSQNFPDLTSAQNSGGATIITGNLNSTQNTTFRIEFFSNTACDASGNGQGMTFIGSTTVSTPPAACDAPFSATLSVAVPVGSFITATATDASNNTSEFSHCVTVTAAPCTITCPANLAKSNAPNQCGATIDYAAPSTSGACGTVTCNPPTGSFFPVGVTGVTCTTAAGPSCMFTVTVNDTQAPTITCPPPVIQSTGLNQCSATVTYPAPTVSDNCPGALIATCNPPSGSTFPKGVTAVTCNVADGSGNPASCNFNVTINDTQPPSITCPPNQSVSSSVPAAVNYPAPTATDNCPGVTSSCSPPSGSVFALGTTPVNCTANDASGNTTGCVFTVTVAPCAITCPPNVSAATGPNSTRCGNNVSYPAPVVTGGCGAATCTPASGSFFAVGITVVTCSIPGGANCSFTVSVLDDALPGITCPGTVNASASPGQSSAVINYPSATVTDNCPGASVQCSPPAGTRFPIGTTVVTCTVTDTGGNSAGCLFAVIVSDQEAPSIKCPANVAVATQTGQTSAIVAYPLPTVGDNVSGVTVVCTPASGTSFPLGVTTVVCSATDAAGNRSFCSFTASVGGPQAKVVIPGDKTTVEFGNPAAVTPARKSPKPKKNPCQIFAIQNIGFAPLVLTYDSIVRTGSDVDSKKIVNQDDTRYFTLNLVAADGSTTPIEPGAVITIQPGSAQQFCLRFNPLIPALAGKTTGVAAADALPDTVTSSVNFRQNAGAMVSVKVLSHIATAIIFINPTNPRQLPIIEFTRSGNDLTVSYAVYDPNLDVTHAKYEFLNSSGEVVGSAFDIDLTEVLRALNLVRGQSFSVEQRFTGAKDHPDIVGVRVTVFDGESSVTDSASLR